jgi:UDP-N-acetylmuramate--alanine ligase
VADAELDLRVPHVVHIVGLGGSIMSAFAAVLVRMGHRVSGSDLRESATLGRMRALGVDAHVGHAAENLPADVDVVIASTAIAPSNPEIRRATELGVPVFTRAETLRAMVAMRRTAAVAGSHGKTTTSSMLALILREAGWRPSFLIGGDLNEVGTNASWEDGEWLVVEADESDGTFLLLAPETAIVNNVEPDHLSHWGDFASLRAGFEQFLDAVPGTRVVSLDDAVAAELARARRREPNLVTFGFADDADYHVAGYEGRRSGSQFVLTRRGQRLGTLELPVPGRHNAKNAAAASALAIELGVPFDAVRRALGGFGGVARRFQFRGERDGVTFVDDYAHLPGEVAHMIEAAREGDWEHVVVVFQPHRYTRTAALWRDFADAFIGADTLVLTDVYGFNEAPQPGVSGRLILRAVLDAHPDQPVVYLPRRGDLVDHVPRLARRGDVVLTLGAGDLTTVPDEWLARVGDG